MDRCDCIYLWMWSMRARCIDGVGKSFMYILFISLSFIIHLHGKCHVARYTNPGITIFRDIIQSIF